MRFANALAGITLLCSSYSSSVSAAEFIHAKSGTNVDQLRAEISSCSRETRSGERPGYMPLTQPSPVSAQAGSAFAVGFLSGIVEARAQAKYLDVCMRRKGYAKLILTAEEEADFKSRTDSASRQAWIAAFLARDNSERIAAALTPVVPPLPTVSPTEAFAVHGLHLSPESLSPAAEVVGRGGAVLRGSATFRASAVAIDGIELGGTLSPKVELGSLLYGVETRTELDPTESSSWCGPITHNTIWGKRVTRPGCITSTLEGYSWEVWPEEYQPLLTRSINVPLTGVQRTGVLRLSMKQLAEFPFELRLAGIQLKTVDFELVKLDGKRPLAVMRLRAPMTSDGHGTLPLWSKRLGFQRTGSGLLVSLSTDGDGTGPNVVG